MSHSIRLRMILVDHNPILPESFRFDGLVGNRLPLLIVLLRGSAPGPAREIGSVLIDLHSPS